MMVCLECCAQTVYFEQTTPYTFGNVLKEKYPDYFKHVLRADWIKDHTISNGEAISTKAGTFIESGAIEMLSLDMIKGTHASLEELNAVILSLLADPCCC